jgi:hypothetical protein
VLADYDTYGGPGPEAVGEPRRPRKVVTFDDVRRG